MDFEEWWREYWGDSWKDGAPVSDWSAGQVEQSRIACKEAWDAGFEEGYKFANKENEEYDKTLTGDRAV